VEISVPSTSACRHGQKILELLSDLAFRDLTSNESPITYHADHPHNPCHLRKKPEDFPTCLSPWRSTANGCQGTLTRLAIISGASAAYFAVFFALLAAWRLCAHQPPEFCTIGPFKIRQPTPEKTLSASKGSRDRFQTLTTYVNRIRIVLKAQPHQNDASPPPTTSACRLAPKERTKYQPCPLHPQSCPLDRH
jgi:hypothetical protein